MALRPSAGATVLQGQFAFVGTHERGGTIEDTFALRIHVPASFPRALPIVNETGGRIPKTGEFHINETDHALCLGSPLGLLQALSKKPTLGGFAENCLVPYLYAISYKLRHGGPLLFGELEHGTPGMLADYMRIFALTSPYQVREALQLLALKKRRANKKPCPCGCGRRTGICKFNGKLRDFRLLAERSWFREQLKGWSLPAPPPNIPKSRKTRSVTPSLLF